MQRPIYIDIHFFSLTSIPFFLNIYIYIGLLCNNNHQWDSAYWNGSNVVATFFFEKLLVALKEKIHAVITCTRLPLVFSRSLIGCCWSNDSVPPQKPNAILEIGVASIFYRDDGVGKSSETVTWIYTLHHQTQPHRRRRSSNNRRKCPLAHHSRLLHM